MFSNRIHYLYSPRASCLLGKSLLFDIHHGRPDMSTPAQTRALPHQRWTEANLVQIVAAEHHACEGPVPGSLLPLAMCFQVSIIWPSTSVANLPNFFPG